MDFAIRDYRPADWPAICRALFRHCLDRLSEDAWTQACGDNEPAIARYPLTSMGGAANVPRLMSLARISMPTMMAMRRPDFGAFAPCRDATLA